MKLSTKLTLLVLVAVLLPLFGLGSVVYVMQKQVTAERLQQQLQQQGTSAIHHIRDHLLESYRDLALVAGSSTLRPPVWTPEFGLNRYLASFPMYDALVYTDPNGKLIAHTASPLLTEGDTSVEHAAADWHKAAQAGARIIDRSTPKQGAMPHYLVFARQVSDPGVAHGWVFAQVNIEKFVGIIQEIKIGRTGHISLFNRNGILIGHPDKSRYGFDVSHYPIMRKPVLDGTGDSGDFFVSWDGREKWGLTIMLPDHPDLADLRWGIIADQTTNELHEPALDLLKTILLGATFFGTVFVLGGLVFAHRLIAPVFEINRSLNSFFAYLNGKAEAPARFKITGDDEFAQIARAIDQSTQAAVTSIRHAREVDALRDEALNRLNAVLQTAFDGYWLVDLEGRLLDVNESAALMLGYTREAMIGLCVKDIDVVDTPADICARVERMLKSGGERFESKHRKQSGEIIDIEASISLLPDRSALVVFVHDITRSKRAEAQLQLAANVFTHAREGIIITDLNANILNVNAAFTDITGYSREEVLGKNPRILSSGKQDKAFYAAMWHDLQTQLYWYGEIWNRRKDGLVVAEMLTISAVPDKRGDIQNYIALFSDITLLKEHQAKLEFVAHYDALTGLPNRLLLGDRLRQSMSQAPRRGQNVAVAFLDLDGFKAVNDTHGHGVGDQLLATLAMRMVQVLRDGDTLARLGGDEFVAVLVDLPDIDAAVPVLTRLLEAAALPFYVGDVVLNVSASLGAAFYPQSEEVDADQLLRQADQAMYQAKLAGKNRYHVFNTDLDRGVRGHHESLERIKQALDEREFILYYQPKVNMRTGKVTGVEALIRWRHPEQGVLPTGVFLPVITVHPLAIEIGEWVLETAMQQIEDWKAAGLSLPVSVNIDAIQLEQADFVDRLQQQMATHPGLVAGDLELEVLETSALRDCVLVSKVIRACGELGVGFALDDFGTGHSSLSYLKRLPAAMLKIDQSFVRDMLHDHDDLAVLHGVVGLAMAFRREVIAEGVETLAQCDMLLQLGCELAQGYVIARPMPAEDIPAWLATWHPDVSWSNRTPISRDNQSIPFATVECRARIVQAASFIRGEVDAPPALHHEQCRFGQWLKGEVPLSKEARPALEALAPLHIEIHALASELICLKQDGHVEAAVARLSELNALRDRLLEKLIDILQ